MKCFNKAHAKRKPKRLATFLIVFLILFSCPVSVFAIPASPAFLDPLAGEVVFEQMSLGGTVAYTSCMSQIYRVTDDFNLSEDSNISKIEFLELNSSPTSNTIEKVYLEIYDGNPFTSESNKIWGDMTTNRLVKSEDTGESVSGYSIHKVTAEMNTSLLSGTYWIVVVMDGPTPYYYWLENGTPGNGSYQDDGQEGMERLDMAFRLLSDGDVIQKPQRQIHHELVTLLTNPTDGTGVRTQNLNYYLNDPIIWGTEVKNITVWLESEIFDLAKAQQKAKLPAGLSLLKDYNIRLMMKIVYNDGTIETKEVDNGDIARNIPVLIPIDEFAGVNDLGIIYMDTEGNTAVLPVTPVTIDGYKFLQFENNHFSEYAVVSGVTQVKDLPAAEPLQQSYTIQQGDTLASIAAKFGVTVQSLATANNISNPDLIYAGDTLIIA